MTELLTSAEIQHHEVVNPEQWLASRRELLRKEKELTRLRDEINRQRRELPWQRVTKQYLFESPNGKETLADLFARKSQLIIYHFMFGPRWKEGCVGCSFHADHMGGALIHLKQRDIAFVVVSRAPLSEIEAFKERMGWQFKWVSSYDSDFNYDYHVSFTPEQIASGKVYYNYEVRDALADEMSGTSVFYKNETDVFHTYSNYARGGEDFLGAYRYIDLTPKGREENGPTFSLGDWVRHHDRYGAGGHVAPTGRYVASKDAEPCCHSTEVVG